MTTVTEMNEAQMRDAKVPWPKSEEELIEYVGALVNRQHDYGTCVYAMSMAAEAAFNFVASKLGVTGFQASYADMDFLRRVRGIKGGFRIVKTENLLYPQYCDDEHFPGVDELMDDKDNKQWLADEARKLIEEKSAIGVHPDVMNHWKMLAGRCPPSAKGTAK